MTAIEIIGVPQSNFVWLTRIACAEKGVPHSVTPAMAHGPEVAAIHPFGKVPAMRHGDLTLFESRAICAYIDRAFDGPALVPTDPVGAAVTEQYVSLVNTGFDPVCVRQYLLGYFFPGTPDGSPDRARIDAAIPQMETQIAWLETRLAARPHLAGEAFSLADIYLVPILFYLGKAPESAAMLGRAPATSAYLDRMLARPSVASTVPPPMPR
jgi:glutathione S-transferase